MQRDPKVFQGVQDRLTSVAGPDWRVYPFNNSKDEMDVQLAKLVDDAFRFTPHFQDSRMRLATAIFRGQSCELMTGKRKMIRLGMMKQAEPVWMFNETKNIDPRRFTIRPIRRVDENGNDKIDTELWMSTIPMFAKAPMKGLDMAPADRSAMSGIMPYGYRKVQHPEWMIRVIYNNDESHLSWGNGAMNAISFFHWLKQILLREGLQGVERWSQGIVVGTLDEDRPGEPDVQTTENEKAAMLDALTKMRSRHVYVQGKQDDIEVVTGGGEGHQMVMGMLDYVDDCIMGVCTGAVLMSSKSNAGDAGSHARDETGKNTQNKIVSSDQKKIDEDISTWKVGLWVRQNWKLVCRLGLANARLPQVKTVQPEDNNPDQFATRIAAVWGAQPKFKIRKDEAYEKLGLTPVNEAEDEFIEGADQSASKGADPNDPAAMMMEGAAGQVAQGASAPSPAAAMRARFAAQDSDALERLIDQKVEARLRAIAQPVPMRAEPQPITMNSAPVNVRVEPPAVQPITMHVEAPKFDERQHAETMAAHDRGAAATMALAEQMARLAARENPATQVHVEAPVVNVAQPEINVAAPDVRVNVEPPSVHVKMAEQKAPVVQFTNASPVVHMNVDDKSAKPLGRIADMLESFFGWFKSRKPADKKVEFKTDKDGHITGAKVESK